MSEGPVKYNVDVFMVDKPAKVSKEVTEGLKGAVSGKMMARMKREAVDCPLLRRQMAFLECFACSNFIRRVKGVVHCAGLLLPEA